MFCSMVTLISAASGRVGGRESEERASADTGERAAEILTKVRTGRKRKKGSRWRSRAREESSSAAPDNTRRKKEDTWRAHSSHINNYCYSVMTDAGHGKTR